MSDASVPQPPRGDGVEMLKAQVERRSRSIPVPRRPRSAPSDGAASLEPRPAPVESPEQEAEPPAAFSSPAADPSLPAPVKRRTGPKAPTPSASAAAKAAGTPDPRPSTQPDEPLANLQVRVRRSLDSRLEDLIHTLRRDGVRTSKVELVELLLWELPAEPSPDLRRRLAGFRRLAPREEPL